MFSKYTVVNANLEKVSYYIDKMLSEDDRYCRCVRCRLDVTALALNTLPPHYFVNPSHAENNDLGSSWILIEMAVREAMEKVLNNPHHNLKDEKGADRPHPGGLPLFVNDPGAEG